MHLEILSNGLGGPSMYLLALAARREIPATISITADTGVEEDRIANDGHRVSAADFFDEIVQPYAEAHGIAAYFVRAKTGTGAPMPTIWQQTEAVLAEGKPTSAKIPLFGSDGGRLGQSCTSRWKVAAIRQQCRALGATTMRAAHGIHTGEALRRMKGANPRRWEGWTTLNDIDGKNKDGTPKIVKWCMRYYPLVEKRLYRHQIEELLRVEGLPYLVTSECDFCPHQDLARWQRHTPERLAEVAALEGKFGGQFFFTDKRIPLLNAIELMARDDGQQAMDLDFGCGNSVCGV